MDRIYLDYAATCPMDLKVVERMLPYFTERYGNPSSLHYFGQQGEAAVDAARRAMLEIWGATAYDLVFTSGGTESDNLALKGLRVSNNQEQKKRILVSPIEHPAVEKTCRHLDEQSEAEIIILRVDNFGIIDVDYLVANLQEDSLVSVVWGNNEIGTINDVEKIAQICHSVKSYLHTDGVQAAAHLNFRLEDLGVDLISVGAHKFGGPKGVGGLILRKSLKLDPQNIGGGQEDGRRGGTHNVPLLVGMQAALENAIDDKETINKKLIHFRDQIIGEVLATIPGSYLTGHPVQRLPNHASFVFEGVKGQDLVIALDMAGYAVSSGSACKVGNPSPSQVLLAIGIPADIAMGALRVTVGRYTKESEVRSFLQILPKIINQLRSA